MAVLVLFFLPGFCLAPAEAKVLKINEAIYMAPGLGPGAYPSGDWDRAKIDREFRRCEGYRFTQTHQAPLWVGEFGAVFNGPPEQIPDRLRGLDDQIAVMEDSGAHWTTWTYKDIGVMGIVTVNTESEYMRAIRPAFKAKLELHAEGWGWLPPSPMDAALEAMNRLIVETVADPGLTPDMNRWSLAKVALNTYVAGLLQTPFARCFKSMSESQIDDVLSSFAFRKCRVNDGQVAVLRRHFSRPA